MITVTSLVVSAYAQTASRLILWFGASGDTTYTPGVDQPLFIASFAPNTASAPGGIEPLAFPIQCLNPDYVLRATDDAGLSVDVNVYGYES